MRFLKTGVLALLLGLAPAAALAGPVVLISIDGLRPGDVLFGTERGVRTPTLHRLVAEGAYAEGVSGVLPTLTYPSHTTLITGVSPACHGVANNLTFDPFQKNQQGWYWYSEDIRVPTLWDAARGAGLTVGNVHWPVSVGAQAIDYNLPQIWRTGEADDRKLVRALATPGLLSSLEARLGPYADGQDESVEGDVVRGRFAEELIKEKRPGFTTVYFTGLDHVQHLFGPDTPQAHAALERIDTAVGGVVAAAREALPGVDVVIVSDHGFAPVQKDVNLVRAFVQAGLVTLAPDGSVASWRAEPWFAGGSAQIVLADPKDRVVAAAVERLLDRLAADPENGVAGWIGAQEIAARGGAPAANYVLFFRLGYEMGRAPAAPPVGPPAVKGMHGYDPRLPEMRSTFIAAGPDVSRTGSLGLMDMRAVAPYVARLLGVAFTPGAGRCGS